MCPRAQPSDLSNGTQSLAARCGRPRPSHKPRRLPGTLDCLCTSRVVSKTHLKLKPPKTKLQTHHAAQHRLLPFSSVSVKSKNIGVILNPGVSSASNSHTVGRFFWCSLQTTPKLSCSPSPPSPPPRVRLSSSLPYRLVLGF